MPQKARQKPRMTSLPTSSSHTLGDVSQDPLNKAFSLRGFQGEVAQCSSHVP